MFASTAVATYILSAPTMTASDGGAMMRRRHLCNQEDSGEVTCFELVVGVRRAVFTRPGHGGRRRRLT
jgi:hypothetical protein